MDEERAAQSCSSVSASLKMSPLFSVAQSCLTLWNPTDCRPPGSSVHGIFPGKNTRVDCYFLLQRIFLTQGLNPHLLCLLHWKWREREVTQLCPTVFNPIDYSLPCSSIHGIFQATVLEWVAISFSRGSSRPRDWTWVSCIVGRRFTISATREILLRWQADFFFLTTEPPGKPKNGPTTYPPNVTQYRS